MTNSTSNTPNSTPRKSYIVDDIDIQDILNTLEEFQDQAMVLSQQIERLLQPQPGADSPHFSAWRLSELLVAHLESGHMQQSVKSHLESELQK